MSQLATYQARLEARICVRRGCTAEPADGSNECAPHAEDSKARKRRYARKRRARFRRRGLCTRCGAKRKPGHRWACPKCIVELGRLAVDNNVDNKRKISRQGFAERLEQSPDGKLRARRRFHGQGKRGRQPASQLDDQDRTDVLKCIDHGFAALEYFRSAEVQAMPRLQREDVRAAAIAKLRQAQRWIDDVIERNDPKSRKSRDESDDD